MTAAHTSSQHESSLQELSWAEIAPIVRKLQDTDIFNALKDVLGETQKLWVARYPYSEFIVNRGTFVPPLNAPSAAKADLAKSCDGRIPLCVVLERSVEVFLSEEETTYTEDRKQATDKKATKTFPLQVIAPGSMFGVFEALDGLHKTAVSPGIYSVSSGAVSIWILSAALKGVNSSLKLTLGKKHQFDWDHKTTPHYKLVKWAMDGTPWRSSGTPWHSTVLVIPASFVAKAASSRAFEQLMFRLAWEQSAHARRRMIAYRHEHHENGNALLDNAPQYRMLVQHLESIQLGQLPAFRLTHCLPHDEDLSHGGADFSGPFLGFQEALWHILREKNTHPYFPLIVQPEQLREAGQTGFCSFTQRLPFLMPKEPSGGRQCVAIAEYNWPIDRYRFFWHPPKADDDSANRKPGSKPDLEYRAKKAFLAKYEKLKIEEILPVEHFARVQKCFGDFTRDNICLDEGFLNSGVMIRR